MPFAEQNKYANLAGLHPAGSIIAFGGSTAPAEWLLCDGSAISRTDYAALFAVLGVAYGSGNGSTTFNIPDLRQRFPLGKAVSGTGAALGESGGTIDHRHDAHTTSTVGNLSLLMSAHTAPDQHNAQNPPYQVVNFIIKV
jgi:microcystin-dependent protein